MTRTLFPAQATVAGKDPTSPAARQEFPENATNAVQRVCLLGGESAGKTTLAVALAERLHTPWVAEYGRERWLEIGGTFSLEELVDVARRQVAREDAAAAGARDWLVCDTSPLTTLVYALADHGHAPPELWALARRNYDRVLLCAPDFDFVQDGARRDDGFRAAQHALTVRLLREFGMPWTEVTGTLAARLHQVMPLLQPAPASAAATDGAARPKPAP
jgi:NadR type nicotinamide-nucleotide adenylyltransferase